MFSVSKSFVAYFLVLSVFPLALGFWFEFYWIIYLVFTSLLGCLWGGAREVSKSELKRLSDLDFYFRMLDATLLIVALLGLAIRSQDRMIQFFCLIVFILYHAVYLRTFSKEVRSKSPEEMKSKWR